MTDCISFRREGRQAERALVGHNELPEVAQNPVLPSGTRKDRFVRAEALPTHLPVGIQILTNKFFFR